MQILKAVKPREAKNINEPSKCPSRDNWWRYDNFDRVFPPGYICAFLAKKDDCENIDDERLVAIEKTCASTNGPIKCLFICTKPELLNEVKAEYPNFEKTNFYGDLI